jgi:hypothetical protein
MENEIWQQAKAWSSANPNLIGSRPANWGTDDQKRLKGQAAIHP